MSFTFSHTLEITNKTGRNEPCPCGSGKKYKKCCLSRGSEYSPQKKEGLISRIVSYLVQFDWYKKIMDELIKEWYPDGISDEDALITVSETAIYEGVYQGASPLAYFIQHNTSLTDSEKELYTQWLVGGVFSFFMVEQSTPGSHLNIQDVRSHKQYTLFDQTSSYRLTKGTLFAGRILPFKDNWIGSGTLTPFPAEYQYSIHRSVSHDNSPITQSALMSILRGPKSKGNIHEISDADLKRKIKSYIKDDAQFKELVHDLENGKEDSMHKALLDLSRLSSDKADEASTYILELYNRHLKAPSHLQPGPKEKELIQMAIHEMSLHPDILKGSTGHELDTWLDAPQGELGGKTPREVIIAERKSRGNPNMDVSYDSNIIEIPSTEKSPYNQGIDALKAEEYLSGIRLLSQVDPERELGDQQYRWYNNVGICFMRLGYVDAAKQYFTHCAQLNPQYDPVKTNLKNFDDDVLIREIQEYGEEIRFQQTIARMEPFNLSETPPIVALLRQFFTYVHNRKMIPLTLASRQIPYKDASALNALFPNPDTYPQNVKPNSGDRMNLPQLALLYRLVSGTYFVKIRLNKLSLTKAGLDAMVWDDFSLWHELFIGISNMRKLSAVIDYFATHPIVKDLSELNNILYPSENDSHTYKSLPIFESYILGSLTLFGLLERDLHESKLCAYRATDTLRTLHAAITRVKDDAIPQRMFTRLV